MKTFIDPIASLVNGVKKASLNFLFILLSFHLSARDKALGIPFITNYTKGEIGFSSQNHGFVQDSRGVIYVANDFGILEFDGQKWGIIQTSTNRSNIISLAVDKNNRIYAGAQGDIGYLDYHNEYKLIFRSLLDKIPLADRQFGDVGQTHVTSQGVVFHSWDATFIYKNDTIKVLKFKELAKKSFLIKDTVYVQANNGIYKLVNDAFVRVNFSSYFNDKEIAFMLPYSDNSFLVGTCLNGVYIAKGSDIKPFVCLEHGAAMNYHLVDGILLKNGNYTFITAQNGVLLIDAYGNLLQHLTKTDGLQSNRIMGLMADCFGNIWLGSTGVDYVELSSPITILPINQDEPFSVYASIVFKENLYVATNSGIYYTAWSALAKNTSEKPVFKKVPNLPDITWNLQNIDNNLIVSTKDGFYQITNERAELLAKTEGAWLVKKIDNEPDLLIGGTYTGLVLLKKVNQKYQLVGKIAGYTESSRVLEQDKLGNVWTSHGYKGAYKLSLNKQYTEVVKQTLYDHKKGFPTNMYIGVHSINNDLVFSSQYGFYSYDSVADSMIINKSFAEKIGTTQHVRLLEQNKNRVWFIFGDTTGFIESFADGSISINTSPFNKLAEYYIPGFENICFLPDGDALIGTKKDLIYYNSQTQNLSNTPFNVLLRTVDMPVNGMTIYDDKYQYLCDTLINPNPTIEYANNNLIFRFSASFYESIKSLKFKYYLEGFDKKESSWIAENHKEYTNLPEGEYIFRVKAKNIYNVVSNEATYSFKVLPPWYRTLYAYIFYLLMLGGIVWLVFRARSAQLRKQMRNFMDKQLKRNALQEAEYNEDKLRAELESKSNELASLASNVIYKNERINEIKAKLSELVPIATDSVKRKLNSVLEFIDKELDDDNWDDFEYRFNQTHNNFIKRFKEAYPELTPKDLKFCAYLRMNLSTKEIAQLLNMTIRGVENARYRIRKRLELDSEENLTNFIISF